MKKEKTEERRNRFNGESIMLTKEEARIHDQIFINEVDSIYTTTFFEQTNKKVNFYTKTKKTLSRL